MDSMQLHTLRCQDGDAMHVGMALGVRVLRFDAVARSPVYGSINRWVSFVLLDLHNMLALHSGGGPSGLLSLGLHVNLLQHVIPLKAHCPCMVRQLESILTQISGYTTLH